MSERLRSDEERNPYEDLSYELLLEEEEGLLKEQEEWESGDSLGQAGPRSLEIERKLCQISEAKEKKE